MSVYDVHSPSGSTFDRILRAAGALLDEGGPGAVTMREVGRRAGVTAMATYRHVADRDALIGRLVDDAFTALAERFDRVAVGDPIEALHRMLSALLDLAIARPHLYALAFTDRRAGARELPADVAHSPTLRLAIDAIARGVEAGRIRPGDPIELAVVSASLIQGLWLSYHAGRLVLPEDEFRALCHRSADRLLGVP